MKSTTYTTLFKYEGACIEMTSRDENREAKVMVRGTPGLDVPESEYAVVAAWLYSNSPYFVNLFRIGKRYEIIVLEVDEDA